jgi:hypothetical protein
MRRKVEDEGHKIEGEGGCGMAMGNFVLSVIGIGGGGRGCLLSLTKRRRMSGSNG